jgi:hypothetical protein
MQRARVHPLLRLPGLCNRFMQATSAVGCSILLCAFAAAAFVWIIILLSVDSKMHNMGYPREYYNSYDYQMPDFYPTCFYTLHYVPSGLTSIASILSAAPRRPSSYRVTLSHVCWKLSTPSTPKAWPLRTSSYLQWSTASPRPYQQGWSQCTWP